jgi:hypothetical protein
VEGDRYDNCPSVHAAQWLKEAEYDWPGTYLWMEAGAVLVDVGTETERYVLAGGNDRPYRCSMCLKTMAGKGIMDVCRVGQDAEGQVTLHFAPVVATLDCLMVCNVAGMMAE